MAQLVALDYGPEGAEITTNLAVAVPAGALLQDLAEPPSSGAGELPLLRVCAPMLPLSHLRVQQVCKHKGLSCMCDIYILCPLLLAQMQPCVCAASYHVRSAAGFIDL